MATGDEARVARRSERAWDRVLVRPAASGAKLPFPGMSVVGVQRKTYARIELFRFDPTRTLPKFSHPPTMSQIMEG